MATTNQRGSNSGRSANRNASRSSSGAGSQGTRRQASSSSSDLSSGATGMVSATRLSSRTIRATQQVNSGVRGKRRKSGGVLSTLFAFVLVAGAIAAVWFFVLPKILPEAGTTDDTRSEIEKGVAVEVVIPDGAGAAAIAQTLYEAGVIDSTSDFLKAMKRQDAEQSLKSGSYIFVTGSDPAEVVRQLVSGPNNTANAFTVPEGLTITKTAAIIETALDISQADFIAACSASSYAEEYPFLANVADDSLEGFLFPKTYDFSGREVTVDLVIRTMLSQYQTEVASLDFEAARAAIHDRYGIEVSDYDILIIASIIERETNTDEDRATVASVIYNRLQVGMPLQCDSTIGYVTGGAVSASDLDTDSPYNTYLNYGLTPTPICSPSIESIKAAMEPEDTDYYYFLITSDTHVFSTTYDEHLAAIEASKSE